MLPKILPHICRLCQTNKVAIRFDFLYTISIYTIQNNRKYINTIGEVLVEGAGQRDGASVAFGKFSNFKMIYFPGDEHLIGQYVTVCVQSIKGNSLFGVLKEDMK